MEQKDGSCEKGISSAYDLQFYIHDDLLSGGGIAPGFFVHLFNSSSQELFEMTKWALRIYMAATGVFGIQLAVQQVFMALGQAKISLFIACLRKIILLIPLIYILPHFFADKVFAVFLAEPVSDFISVIVAATLFFLNIKRY